MHVTSAQLNAAADALEAVRPAAITSDQLVEHLLAGFDVAPGATAYRSEPGRLHLRVSFAELVSRLTAAGEAGRALVETVVAPARPFANASFAPYRSSPVPVANSRYGVISYWDTGAHGHVEQLQHAIGHLEAARTAASALHEAGTDATTFAPRWRDLPAHQRWRAGGDDGWVAGNDGRWRRPGPEEQQHFTKLQVALSQLVRSHELPLRGGSTDAAITRTVEATRELAARTRTLENAEQRIQEAASFPVATARERLRAAFGGFVDGSAKTFDHTGEPMHRSGSDERGFAFGPDPVETYVRTRALQRAAERESTADPRPVGAALVHLNHTATHARHLADTMEHHLRRTGAALDRPQLLFNTWGRRAEPLRASSMGGLEEATNLVRLIDGTPPAPQVAPKRGRGKQAPTTLDNALTTWARAAAGGEMLRGIAAVDELSRLRSILPHVQNYAGWFSNQPAVEDVRAALPTFEEMLAHVEGTPLHDVVAPRLAEATAALDVLDRHGHGGTTGLAQTTLTLAADAAPIAPYGATARDIVRFVPHGGAAVVTHVADAGGVLTPITHPEVAGAANVLARLDAEFGGDAFDAIVEQSRHAMRTRLADGAEIAAGADGRRELHRLSADILAPTLAASPSPSPHAPTPTPVPVASRRERSAPMDQFPPATPDEIAAHPHGTPQLALFRAGDDPDQLAFDA